MKERMEALRGDIQKVRELAESDAECGVINSRSLLYYLEELERWRKTGLAVMSEYTRKLDSLIATGDKADMQKSLSELREVFRYSMLHGVYVKNRKTVRLTFPVEVLVRRADDFKRSVLESGYAESEYDASDGFSEAIAAITKFNDQLPDSGLWSMFPEDSYLYDRVASAFPRIERSEGEIIGNMFVEFKRSVTGYELAMIISFLERQMRLTVSQQVWLDEQEIPNGYVRLNLAPGDDWKMTPPPDFREDTDMSVMLSILNSPAFKRNGTLVTSTNNKIVIDSPDSSGVFTFHFDENEALV